MSSIDTQNLPRHVAIIMDGNGRWAVRKGLDRVEGHRRGVEVAEDIIMYASDLGLSHLTLYAFSKENWNRPSEEITTLMALLKIFLLGKKQKMLDRQISFQTIGDMSLLPADIQKIIADIREETSSGRGLKLTLALSYGSRDEILRAVQKIILQKPDQPLNEAVFREYLDTAGMPDPDLIIRTSGEFRMSNFLLWQGAYAEYFFEECFWPDFTPGHFLKAIEDYQKRERRYGKI